MNNFRYLIVALLASGFAIFSATSAQAISTSFTGTQYDIGDTFFPGGGLPYVTVPWRSDSASNVFAVSSDSPNRYYGTAGYAMFNTIFLYPQDENVGTSIPPEGDPLFPNLIDLPIWVTNNITLASSGAGGYTYALVDDPVLQHGIRHWTFDGVNYPPATAENQTGQNPYVKIGIINGSDVLGNDPALVPTARWGFEVGADVPAGFRLGVMSDGLDATHFAAAEVFLSQVTFNELTLEFEVISTIGSGVVTRNRYIDMHFFDITDAQPGDQFVISAMKGAADPGFASAAISGISFDVLPAAPALDGDYNDDGIVDARDYALWRESNGMAITLPNDTTPGSVGPEDYDVWAANYGAGALGAGAVAVSVPEPASWLLALSLAAAAGLFRRR